jgi:hypothetical protein
MTRMHRRVLILVVAGTVVTGCKVYDPLYCDERSGCVDPARPFCDLEGEYPASEGVPRTCIPDPDGGEPDGGGPSADGGIGGDAGPDICADWEPAFPFEPCDIPVDERGSPLILAGAGIYTYDTDSGELAVPGGGRMEPVADEVDGIRRVHAELIQIDAGTILKVRGSKPLLLASWSLIEIRGEIDLTSSKDGGNGAGANPQVCLDAQFPPGAGSNNLNGGGGGGGGGFGGRGGQGGFGAGAIETGGRSGGTAKGRVEQLRGGCSGGVGGRVDTAGPGTAAGSGGGAIALSARVEILISGVVHAGGGGGIGGASNQLHGGGGGGSGGMLWLDSPRVSLEASARLIAEGGGGGEGSDGDLDLPSGDGQSGTTDNNQALGGQGGGSGGNGGGGSGGGNGVAGLDGDDRKDVAGGGGGGGSGIIRVNGDLDLEPGALIRPTATP